MLHKRRKTQTHHSRTYTNPVEQKTVDESLAKDTTTGHPPNTAHPAQDLDLTTRKFLIFLRVAMTVSANWNTFFSASDVQTVSVAVDGSFPAIYRRAASKNENKDHTLHKGMHPSYQVHQRRISTFCPFSQSMKACNAYRNEKLIECAPLI